jgi:hypothetical protein
MKILKIVLVIILIIVAVPLIVALFTKKEFTVQRQITINKPRQDVFNYIKLIKNQDTYSKWMQMDPNAKKTYTGTDGTVGFVAGWDSDNKEVGKGTQTISKIIEGDSLVVDLHFIKPFDGQATGYMATGDDGGNTKVTWGMRGRMPYPLNIMLLLSNEDKMGGDDLGTGLANLKKLLEKQ